MRHLWLLPGYNHLRVSNHRIQDCALQPYDYRTRTRIFDTGSVVTRARCLCCREPGTRRSSRLPSFVTISTSGAAAAWRTTALPALMLLCACSIFAIVAFIFWILVVRSHLSLVEFGWKFFIRDGVGPGRRRLWRASVYLWNACDFVSRTADGGAAGARRGGLRHGTLPEAASRAHLFPYRVAGGDSQRRVWPVGGLRAGPADAGLSSVRFCIRRWAGQDFLKAPTSASDCLRRALSSRS